MKNNKNNFQSNFATLRAFPMGNDTFSSSLGRPLATKPSKVAFHAALEPNLAILRLLGRRLFGPFTSKAISRPAFFTFRTTVADFRCICEGHSITWSFVGDFIKTILKHSVQFVLHL